MASSADRSVQGEGRVLVVGGGVPLVDTLVEALRRDGVSAARAAPEDDDIFGKAAGHEALVYVPARCLLDGTLHPQPSQERARAVLGAANAPGVSLVVLLVPAAGYEEEEALLRRSGSPYLILRSPPVLEEIAEHIQTDRTLWLPRGGRFVATSAADVARAVRGALDDERQGRIVEVPSTELDAAALFERAAEAVRIPAQIRSVWPPVFRAARPIFRTLHGDEPAAFRVLDAFLEGSLPRGDRLGAAA